MPHGNPFDRLLAAQAKTNNLLLANTGLAFAQFVGVVLLGSVASGVPLADSDDTRLVQSADFDLIEAKLARSIPVPCGYIHRGPVDRHTGSGHWLPRLIQPDLGSYQDATDAKHGSLGTSISAVQTLGLAGDWLPRVGVGIKSDKHLSCCKLGSGNRCHCCLAA